MGCDIHCFVEKHNKETNKWEETKGNFSYFGQEDWELDYIDTPFYWRDYTMFAIFANVRNGGKVKPISFPKGLPKDVSDKVKNIRQGMIDADTDVHSSSYLTIDELIAFDYDRAGVREELDIMYFKHLEEIKELGSPKEVRIVFWFDN